jgi:2-dehydro-3-deoxyphosphogluconate aldolase / (4S)-4-hydroxy-2-oxoglutarate aldolase
MAILRSSQSRCLDPCIETLLAAGIRSIEVTLTTPEALATVARWKNAVPADARLGCGTVLTPSEAEAAIDHGADFVVAPNFSASVVQICRRLNIPVFPAAWSSTEVVEAWEAGATAVKLFPASVAGPDYVRHLRGPLPDIRLLPTGGVTVEEIPAYLRAGADAVGLGGPLLGDALSGGSLTALADRARSALHFVDTATASDR